MTETSFPWKTILAHLSRNAALCRGILGAQVMTTGKGPCDESDFDDFLIACGMTVFSVSHKGPNVLVIGHNEWNKKEINEAIEARVGGTLKVYSQEMVFTSLAVGADVFDVLSTEDLVAFADGHAALEYLIQDFGFDWPNTEVILGEYLNVNFADSGQWPETGVLKKMGYSVGNKGLVENKRHNVLDRVYKVRLIPNSEETDKYINQWGEPQSPKRLLKIANCLASFAKSKKRVLSRVYGKAISDWESDLKWMRRTYYHSDFNFPWPDTRVFPR